MSVDNSDKRLLDGPLGATTETDRVVAAYGVLKRAQEGGWTNDEAADLMEALDLDEHPRVARVVAKCRQQGDRVFKLGLVSAPQ